MLDMCYLMTLHFLTRLFNFFVIIGFKSPFSRFYFLTLIMSGFNWIYPDVNHFLSFRVFYTMWVYLNFLCWLPLYKFFDLYLNALVWIFHEVCKSTIISFFIKKCFFIFYIVPLFPLPSLPSLFFRLSILFWLMWWSSLYMHLYIYEITVLSLLFLCSLTCHNTSCYFKENELIMLLKGSLLVISEPTGIFHYFHHIKFMTFYSSNYCLLKSIKRSINLKSNVCSLILQV